MLEQRRFYAAIVAGGVISNPNRKQYGAKQRLLPSAVGRNASAARTQNQSHPKPGTSGKPKAALKSTRDHPETQRGDVS